MAALWPPPAAPPWGFGHSLPTQRRGTRSASRAGHGERSEARGVEPPRAGEVKGSVRDSHAEGEVEVEGGRVAGERGREEVGGERAVEEAVAGMGGERDMGGRGHGIERWSWQATGTRKEYG